jgi:hypothetical protein
MTRRSLATRAVALATGLVAMLGLLCVPSAAPALASDTGAVHGASVVVPAGVTAGVAVFDRVNGTFTEQLNTTMQFRSASVVKLLIALDYLWPLGPAYQIPPADRARLDVMLRSSDDDAASDFYVRGGYEAIINRMVPRLNLRNTAPPPANLRGYWGYTAISAADVVRIYRFLLDTAPAPVREYVMGNLHQSTKCGTDGFNQSFGIPSAFARPWPPGRSARRPASIG